MKKMIIILVIIFCLVAGLGIAVVIIERNRDSDVSPAGVWWWHEELSTETYLNFAIDNNINEIYFHASKFDDETKNFISQANSNNIKVYWLAGRYEWLNDHTQLFEQINDYVDYQNKNPNAKFEGIHLDIEPHQSPNFETDRYQLIYNLIDLANILKNEFPTIKFDYDLPFWLHDQITYNNQTKLAYEFMIDVANRVFIMSYRDTADEILDIAKEEINYAKQQNKQMFLCVETGENKDDFVSFFEEGKQAMTEVLVKLRKEIPKNFGISIHHIRAWYELKD